MKTDIDVIDNIVQAIDILENFKQQEKPKRGRPKKEGI